ncbi:hypothetical protein HY251_14350 [bacterium]|nr:hypothetical protein [bacterium]
MSETSPGREIGELVALATVGDGTLREADEHRIVKVAAKHGLTPTETRVAVEAALGALGARRAGATLPGMPPVTPEPAPVTPPPRPKPKEPVQRETERPKATPREKPEKPPTPREKPVEKPPTPREKPVEKPATPREKPVERPAAPPPEAAPAVEANAAPPTFMDTSAPAAISTLLDDVPAPPIVEATAPELEPVPEPEPEPEPAPEPVAAEVERLAPHEPEPVPAELEAHLEPEPARAEERPEEPPLEVATEAPFDAPTPDTPLELPAPEAPPEPVLVPRASVTDTTLKKTITKSLKRRPTERHVRPPDTTPRPPAPRAEQAALPPDGGSSDEVVVAELVPVEEQPVSGRRGALPTDSDAVVAELVSPGPTPGPLPRPATGRIQPATGRAQKPATGSVAVVCKGCLAQIPSHDFRDGRAERLASGVAHCRVCFSKLRAGLICATCYGVLGRPELQDGRALPVGDRAYHARCLRP